MNTAYNLFDKAKELAYDEAIKEVSDNLSLDCYLGCVQVTSECGYDIKELMVPVVDLLEKDWQYTSSQNYNHQRQKDEVDGYWTVIFNSLEVFIQEKRKLMDKS